MVARRRQLRVCRLTTQACTALPQAERAGLAQALRGRLAQAAQLDAQADILSSHIAELEVRRIELDLDASGQEVASSYERSDQAAIGELLLRRDAVERRLSSLLGGDGKHRAEQDDELPRLKEAADALAAWAKAKEPKTSKRVELSVRVVMLMAVLAAVWGALAVHWSVLVLLIPVVGPLSALLNRGDDAQWVRLGAERRFSATHLAAPEWHADAVQSRLDALQKEITALEAAREAPPPPVQPVPENDADARFAELSIERVEVELTLKARLRRVGLDADDLEPVLATAFRAAAQAARIQSELREVTAERARIAKEAGEHRDTIWRELNRLGLTEGDPSTCAQVLEAQIAVLEASQSAP